MAPWTPTGPGAGPPARKKISPPPKQDGGEIGKKETAGYLFSMNSATLGP